MSRLNVASCHPSPTASAASNTPSRSRGFSPRLGESAELRLESIRCSAQRSCCRTAPRPFAEYTQADAGPTWQFRVVASQQPANATLQAYAAGFWRRELIGFLSEREADHIQHIGWPAATSAANADRSPAMLAAHGAGDRAAARRVGRPRQPSRSCEQWASAAASSAPCSVP